MVSGYKKKLRMPVIRALLYIQGLSDRVPGPFEANRKAYGANPQINALFGSAAQLQELFSLNEKMQHFFTANPGDDLAYASLGMIKREKNTFGAALFGNIVRKDIAQVTVNFSGHWVGVCAPSLDEARAQMRWRAFNSLVDSALERITDIKSTTKTLEMERAMLRIKLKETRAQNRGLDVPRRRSLAGRRCLAKNTTTPGRNRTEAQGMSGKSRHSGRLLHPDCTGAGASFSLSQSKRTEHSGQSNGHQDGGKRRSGECHRDGPDNGRKEDAFQRRPGGVPPRGNA